MKAVLDVIHQNESLYLEELMEFLKIPSVSADSEYQQDMGDCADYLVTMLEKIGLNGVRRINTKKHPIVYGEWLEAKDQPTILFYGHYDVQPADPIDLWESPPFEPTIRGDQLYARGVSDDKGQVFCHLKAIEATLKTTGRLPVNIKLIIEGEEEIGSPNLVPFVRENAEMLKSDFCVISDTPMYDKTQPSICCSLRGLVYLELMIKGAKSDLHSGQNGGAVPNPIQAAADIISKLKDSSGRILIPGFYEDVPEISEEIKKQIRGLSFNEEKFKEAVGVSELTGEQDYHPLERLWFRPTLDCNGIVGGYIKEGAKTVIPSETTLKLSMRLVGNQDPVKIVSLFKSYLKDIIPTGVSVELIEHAGAAPVQVNTDTKAIQAAVLALEKAFEKKPVFLGEGGSIPVVAYFEKYLNIQTVLMGFNLPDDGIHAPNERFGLDNFKKGTVAAAYFYHFLGGNR